VKPGLRSAKRVAELQGAAGFVGSANQLVSSGAIHLLVLY
jgi:hypothetical protein